MNEYNICTKSLKDLAINESTIDVVILLKKDYSIAIIFISYLFFYFQDLLNIFGRHSGENC